MVKFYNFELTKFPVEIISVESIDPFSPSVRVSPRGINVFTRSDDNENHNDRVRNLGSFKAWKKIFSREWWYIIYNIPVAYNVVVDQTIGSLKRQ